MELIFTIFGTTIEFRVGPTVEAQEDEGSEIVMPHTASQVEHIGIGFASADPAFQDKYPYEDEDV